MCGLIPSIGKLEDHGLFDVLLSKEEVLVKELEEWELHEEIYWKQKAQDNWLQEGDRNTKKITI